MNVLFNLGEPEQIRLFRPVLQELTARGHRLRVAFTDPEKGDLPAATEALRALGAVVDAAPLRRDDPAGAWFRRLRGAMDYVRLLHPRFRNAHALRARLAGQFPGWARPFGALSTLPAPAVAALLRTLGWVEHRAGSNPAVAARVAAARPDLVVVAPLVTPAAPQADVLVTCHALGIPCAAAIASWDNLTNKGLIHGAPDAVLVWNAHQKGEAVQLHGVPERRVLAVGAPVVDAWLGRHAGRSAAEIATAFDLDAGRPYLLYVCSSRHIVADREPAFVRSWIAALRDAPSPALRALQVVVRPHPDNTADWYDGALAGITGVRVWPQECLRQDEHGEQLYFDVVSRSRAIVGINTTAMLEGALVGRPVFTVVAPEFARTQGSLPHFENLAGAGFVSLAATMDAHVAQLALVCEQPDTCGGGPNPAALAFVRSGAGPATTTFVDTLERLAAQPR